MTCPICEKEVRQVSSATPELALFQHLLWIHNVQELEAARSPCPCGLGDEPWHYPRGGVCAVGETMPVVRRPVND